MHNLQSKYVVNYLTTGESIYRDSIQTLGRPSTPGPNQYKYYIISFMRYFTLIVLSLTCNINLKSKCLM